MAHQGNTFPPSLGGGVGGAILVERGKTNSGSAPGSQSSSDATASTSGGGHGFDFLLK